MQASNMNFHTPALHSLHAQRPVKFTLAHTAAVKFTPPHLVQVILLAITQPQRALSPRRQHRSALIIRQASQHLAAGEIRNRAKQGRQNDMHGCVATAQLAGWQK